MTTHRTIRNIIQALIAGLFVAVLSSASTVAFAAGKGGGGGNHAGNNRPTENMTLNYTKIEHEYKPQKPDGTDATAKTSANKKTGTTKGKRQEYMKYEMNNVYISH